VINKKQVFVFSLLIILGIGRIISQVGNNLVPNPSFVEIGGCSPPGYDLNLLNWLPKIGNDKSFCLQTPNLYHSCNGFVPIVTLPPDFCRNIPSLDADAYVDIWIDTDFSTGSWREFIAVELISPLQAHQNYCISFYKSYCDSNSVVVNTLSVGFFKELCPIPNVSFSLYPYIPEYVTDTILYDTVQKGWQRVEYNYIAKGDEKFVIVGWIEDVDKLQITYLVPDTVPNQNHNSSVYLDSVVVRACNNELGMNIDNLFVPNVITSNGDGINDDWILQQGDTNIPAVGVEIYNRWGELVYINQDYHGEWHGQTMLDKEVSEGVYYYRISLPPHQQKAGFISVFK
jgi:gliding motility-associated-like protein